LARRHHERVEVGPALAVREALLLAAQKMPIKCKIIGREDVEAAE